MLPYFHGYGMTTMLNLPIYLGATIVIEPRFQVDNFFNLVEQYKPNAFCGVPPIYAAILNSPRIKKADLRSFNVSISGGSSLDPELLERFQKLINGPVIEGYGLSEASPVTHANPAFGKKKANSIGLPFPDVEAKVVDRETGTQALPSRESGELLIKGPQVMRHYWEKPDKTAHVLKAGWLHTGDIAFMDEEGYFYLTGRKKNIIITGGFNVFPSEVEEVLSQHPRIKEVKVVGEKGKYGLETVKAIVELHKGSTLDQREIMNFCMGKMARYKIPKIIGLKK